jgi:hypothetical protein
MLKVRFMRSRNKFGMTVSIFYYEKPHRTGFLIGVLKYDLLVMELLKGILVVHNRLPRRIISATPQ